MELSSKTRKWLGLGLRLLLAGALVVLLGKMVSWREFYTNLRGVNPVLLGIGIALSIPNLILQIAKWWLLVRRHIPAVTYGEATRSFLCGTAVGVVTPGRVGEMTRGAMLGTGDPVRLSGAVFLDKALNFGPLLVYLAIALWRAGGPIPTLPVLVALAAYIYFVCAPQHAGPRLARLGRSPDSLIRRFLVAFSELDRPCALQTTVLSVALYICVHLQFWICLAAYAPGASFHAATAGFVALCFASSVPLAPGGVGTREAGTMVAVAAFGISPAAGLNSSLILFLTNLVIPSIGGGLLLLRGGIPSKPGSDPSSGKRDLREVVASSVEPSQP